MAHIEELKEQYPLDLDKSKLTGPAVIDALYNITKGDAIVTTDVGQHQMWAAQFYKYTEIKTAYYIRWTWNNGIWCWSLYRCQDGQLKIKFV